MNSKPRCDRCRFWGDSDVWRWDAEASGFKLCTAVKERWRITDIVGIDRYDDTDAWLAAATRALVSARAYVEDGSEYKAYLWTGPDFFCALFEPVAGDPKNVGEVREP